MNNQILSYEMMMRIVRNGTYYYPATKHYDYKSTNVMCDRCRKSNLPMCIGFERYDLCLSCVQEIGNLYSTPAVYGPPGVFGLVPEQFPPSMNAEWFDKIEI